MDAPAGGVFCRTEQVATLECRHSGRVACLTCLAAVSFVGESLLRMKYAKCHEKAARLLEPSEDAVQPPRGERCILQGNAGVLMCIFLLICRW
jgi:hypothetical protein